MQQLPVVVRLLGEAESRVQDDPLRIDPRPLAGFQPVAQGPGDIVDHIGVHGELLHVGRVCPPVHRHVVDLESGDRGQHLLVGQAAGHVIDHLRASGHTRPGNRRPGGVDAHRDACLRQRGHHRHDSLEFGLQADPCGTRTGGLPSDVDPLRTRCGHRDTRSHGLRNVAVLSAVAERIGRDVQHAHDNGHRPSINAIASARVAESRN